MTNTHHVADVVARYQKTFFDKLDVGILVGASQEKDNVKWFEAKRYDLLADNLSVINGATGDSETSGAATDWVMRSYFGRINLSWADKYLFEGIFAGTVLPASIRIIDGDVPFFLLGMAYVGRELYEVN